MRSTPTLSDLRHRPIARRLPVILGESSPFRAQRRRNSHARQRIQHHHENETVVSPLVSNMFEMPRLLRPLLKASLVLLRAVLVAPWVVVAILMAAIRLAFDARTAYAAGRAAYVERVRCPRGHESNLHGIFECRCGALFAGWGFGRCPVCAECCGYISCEHCGLAVQNPIVRVLLSRTACSWAR